MNNSERMTAKLRGPHPTLDLMEASALPGGLMLKGRRDAEPTESDLKDPFQGVPKPLPDCGLEKRRNGFDEAISKLQQVRSGRPQGRPLFEGTGGYFGGT